MLAFFRQIQKLASGKKVVSPPGELFVFKLTSSEFRLLSSVLEMRNLSQIDYTAIQDGRHYTESDGEERSLHLMWN